jgi:hypothetical protein
VTTGDESCLWRRRRECHVCIAGKGPENEENHQIALSGIISHLTARCSGNVHDRGAVEITVNSVSEPYYIGMLPTSVA